MKTQRSPILARLAPIIPAAGSVLALFALLLGVLIGLTGPALAVPISEQATAAAGLAESADQTGFDSLTAIIAALILAAGLIAQPWKRDR